MEKSPIERNLNIFRKTTKSYKLTVTKDGVVEDITDWTFYLTVKEKVTDSDDDAKIKKDITTHSDPTNGVTYISLTKTDTDILGSLYYDVKFKDDDGNIGIFVYGRMTFKKPITLRE